MLRYTLETHSKYIFWVEVNLKRSKVKKIRGGLYCIMSISMIRLSKIVMHKYCECALLKLGLSITWLVEEKYALPIIKIVRATKNNSFCILKKRKTETVKILKIYKLF